MGMLIECGVLDDMRATNLITKVEVYPEMCIGCKNRNKSPENCPFVQAVKKLDLESGRRARGMDDEIIAF
jgi:hypothetical protein